MKATTKTAIKWGLITGVANLVWLYLSYYLGLHTNGVKLIQLVTLGWVGITFTGIIVGLRTIRPMTEGWNFWAGMRNGLVMAEVGAVLAVIGQVGYFTVVHPEFTDYMVEETRAHFTEAGASDEEITARVAAAKAAFSLQSYAVQALISSLVGGIILSAFIMVFLQNPVNAQTAELPTAQEEMVAETPDVAPSTPAPKEKLALPVKPEPIDKPAKPSAQKPTTAESAEKPTVAKSDNAAE